MIFCNNSYLKKIWRFLAVWLTNLSVTTSPWTRDAPKGHGVVTPSLGSLCWKSTAAGRNAGGTSAGRGAGDGGGEDFRCFVVCGWEIHWQYTGNTWEIPENNWCLNYFKCLRCIFCGCDTFLRRNRCKGQKREQSRASPTRRCPTVGGIPPN